MPTPKPLDPLFTLGDTILQLAPHNLLAKGGISISPVMGRQPTLYEEMNRPVPPSTPRVKPSPVPATVSKTPTIFDAGDGLLELAPHNVLATLLTGGQGRYGATRPSGTPPAPTGEGVPGAELPGPMQSIPANITLMKNASASGNYKYETFNTAFLTKGGQLKVSHPTDYALVVSMQMMKRMKHEERVGVPQQTSAFQTFPDSDPDYVPSKEAPRQFIIGPSTKMQGASDGVTFQEIRSQDYREEKGPAGVFVLKKWTTDYGTRVILLGVIPVPKEVPKPSVEDLSGLRAQYLGDIDGWMDDARSKISVMSHSDIPQADGVVSDITSAMSSLSQANASGQAPAFPLFTGGALPPFPLFSGGALPFLTLPPLFPMARGGQVGSATSYVSNLTSLQSQATSLRDQMKDELDAADEFYSGLQGNRSDVATAQNKQGIETNYAQAKSNYNNIAQIASKVHGEAADITSYRDRAKSNYNAGIASVTGQAPPGADAASQAAAQRAQQIAESNRLEAESAANEARMKADAEAERARNAAQQTASREALQQRIASEKEAAAAKAAQEQADQEEKIRQFQEKARQEQAARQAAEQQKIEERRQKLGSVSEEAARIRQEAARKKLKRK